MNGEAPGLIFLSHAREDKDFVQEILNSIPDTHVFYDVRSMVPGASTVEEMKRGVNAASLFVIFVSTIIDAKEWVQYEASLAEIEKARRKNLEILVVPIKGATYAQAPIWMQKYFATNQNYTTRDIARVIRNLYEKALRNSGELRGNLYLGREELDGKVVRQIRTAQFKSGIPINVVIFNGIQAMGRWTFASSVIPKIFPGQQPIYPKFDLPRQAEAKDLFLTLRSDIEGRLSDERLKALNEEWPDADPKKSAEIIHANLNHFSIINQPVVINCARGIRDGRSLKPWVGHLFELLRQTPDTKVIWLTEIGLSLSDLSRFPNIFQHEVGELSPDSIFNLLCELLELKNTSPLELEEISKNIGGHAGTAHHVAGVIQRGQRSPETILADPEFLVSYQQQFVEELLERKNLDAAQFSILQILAVLPSLDFNAIVSAVDPIGRVEVVRALDDLTQYGIVTYSMNLHYKVPEIVRSVFLIKHGGGDKELIQKVANILGKRVQENNFTIAAVNGLVFANVLLGEKIPDAFSKIITPALLHDLVYEQYQLGMRFEKEYRSHFETAAKLAELSDVIPMNNDAYETVLFYAADGLVRIGGDPFPLVQKLEKRGLGGAAYIRGSYAYHRDHDSAKAIKFLQIAYQKGSFTNRTSVLLAKAYCDLNEPAKALRFFEEEIGEDRVKRNSGLLVQMIRCLRAVGRFPDANRLTKELSRLSDDRADFEMMQAAANFRNGKYDDALDYVNRAKSKSLVDRVNVALLEAAIRVEKGDLSLFDETVNLAIGVGRTDDAVSLRARAALKQHGGWREAEELLRKIAKLTFYDKVLLLRALLQKIETPELKADPVASKDLKSEIDRLTLETKRTIEGFDR